MSRRVELFNPGGALPGRYRPVPIHPFFVLTRFASLLSMKPRRIEAGPGLEPSKAAAPPSGPLLGGRVPAKLARPGEGPVDTSQRLSHRDSASESGAPKPTRPAGRPRPRSSPRPHTGAPAWDREALYQRIHARIRARHLSPRTEKTYIGWIRRFLAHHGGRDPSTLGRPQIEAFIEHLAQQHGLGADSQNQAASAVTFLYREIYGIDYGGKGGVSRAKAPSVMPKYAAPEEVDQVLGRLRGISRVAALIMYGSGTRISETVNLRIKDLSLGSGELVVRAGKGMKDRTTVIPKGAFPEIRAQMQQVEELHIRDLEAGAGWAPLPAALHRKDPRAGWDLGWQFLFPSSKVTFDPKTRRRGRRAIHVTAIQRAVKRAARESGIPRPITCHVLRHCFATELLRSGCDIRLLQRLMGHRDLKTTSRYLHIINRPGLNVVSPLDRLPSFRIHTDT